jgi:hypothetical protein
MVKKIFYGLAIATFCSCCGKGELDTLQLNKVDYTSNELRVDGYYYTTYTNNSKQLFNAICLYRNGLFLDLTNPSKLENLGDLDSFIRGRYAAYSGSSRPEPCWGLFQVEPSKIKIERYLYVSNGNYPTSIFEGTIKNDTTFDMTLFGRASTWYFRGFRPKPDSAGVVLKLK